MEKPSPRIQLKHGAGGRAMRQLIEEVFLRLASPVDGIGLSALEDGFARADLERIVASMREAADEAGVPVVTGDTKVMGRGELDGIVLNTTGVALADRVVTDAGLTPGDAILVTG